MVKNNFTISNRSKLYNYLEEAHFVRRCFLISEESFMGAHAQSNLRNGHSLCSLHIEMVVVR